jgi:hypothetical protein
MRHRNSKGRADIDVPLNSLCGSLAKIRLFSFCRWAAINYREHCYLLMKTVTSKSTFLYLATAIAAAANRKISYFLLKALVKAKNPSLQLAKYQNNVQQHCSSLFSLLSLFSLAKINPRSAFPIFAFFRSLKGLSKALLFADTYPLLCPFPSSSQAIIKNKEQQQPALPSLFVPLIYLGLPPCA